MELVLPVGAEIVVVAIGADGPDAVQLHPPAEAGGELVHLVVVHVAADVAEADGAIAEAERQEDVEAADGAIFLAAAQRDFDGRSNRVGLGGGRDGKGRGGAEQRGDGGGSHGCRSRFWNAPGFETKRPAMTAGRYRVESSY